MLLALGRVLDVAFGHLVHISMVTGQRPQRGADGGQTVIGTRRSALQFMREAGLQVLLATPPDKSGALLPYVDTVCTVVRKNSHAFVIEIDKSENRAKAPTLPSPVAEMRDRGGDTQHTFFIYFTALPAPTSVLVSRPCSSPNASAFPPKTGALAHCTMC